jgi:hypothetical protein
MADTTNIWSSNYMVRAYPAYAQDGAAVILRAKTHEGKCYIASLSWQELKEDDFAFEPQPLFVLQRQQAQVLMDDLWASGVRPTEGAGSAGAMREAQEHIATLRKVAYKVLEIDK